MRKLLVYELNEVPWRVVDFYVARRPGSTLAAFLEGAAQITTRTTDSGELHPWSTWPTMHRGVDNDVHNIRFINQDLSSARAWPPLWEILVANRRTVGIVGSLQSYPPLQHEHCLFHVPDTFAKGPETIPARYRAFQALNLELTRENKAVASTVRLSELLAGFSLLRAGVRPSTGYRLAEQLAREKTNPLWRSLRPMLQAHVAFDVFVNALGGAGPDYAAFFSNHVAGMMHRYWRYAFPEDFAEALPQTPHARFHAESILKAMDIFDGQLRWMVGFAGRHGYDVVVASSMGQEAIDRGTYVPELLLDSIEPLARALGFPAPVRLNLAMQPDVALEFDNEGDLQAFLDLMPRLVDPEGQPVMCLIYQPQGRTLNLSVRRSPATVREHRLHVGNEAYKPEELGFRLISRDPGTGYHQPDGILLWKGELQPDLAPRTVVDSRRYAPTILSALGVSPASYMMEALPVRVAVPQLAA